MAVKPPKETSTTDKPSVRPTTEKRPPLPQAMPIQYHETIQKSWRGHHVPAVPTKDQRPNP